MVKQSCSLFCVRKDTKALLLLTAAFIIIKLWPRSVTASAGLTGEEAVMRLKARTHMDSRGVTCDRPKVIKPNKMESVHHAIKTQGCKTCWIWTILTFSHCRASCPVRWTSKDWNKCAAYTWLLTVYTVSWLQPFHVPVLQLCSSQFLNTLQDLKHDSNYSLVAYCGQSACAIFYSVDI